MYLRFCQNLDQQWLRPYSLLRPKRSKESVIPPDRVNAVQSALRTGISLADLPTRYDNPNTVWKRFDRWYANGAWETMAKALSDPSSKEAHLDFRSVKVIPSPGRGAATCSKARRRPRPAVPRIRARRTDDQTAQRRRRLRSAFAFDSNSRSTRRFLSESIREVILR